MEDKPKKIWFKAKNYGYGWYPATWEGWLVLFGYLILAFAGAAWLEMRELSDFGKKDLAAYLAFVLIITGTLIYICWKKGEKARWRWGGKD